MKEPVIQAIPAWLFDTAIVLTRDGVAQASQNFHVVWRPRPAEREQAGGTSPQVYLELIGAATSNIETGDQFTLDGKPFEVLYARPPQGGVMRVSECIAYG